MKTTSNFLKKIYGLLSVFFMIGIVQAQVLSIPDTNFKNKLLQASVSNTIAKDINGNNMVIDANGDGEIQQWEALAVYELDVHTSDINDLTGIEHFANLSVLDCSENNLTKLDLSSNFKLNNMWIIHNPLSFVNVKNGSTFEGIGETDWINIWGNLPHNCYVCADEFEVSHIDLYLNILGSTGKHVSSYCSFAPGGEYNTITGKLTYDSNGDGSCNNLDLHRPFMKISTLEGFYSSFTNSLGDYVFFTQVGVFHLFPQTENPDYFSIPVEGNKAVFPLLNETQVVDVCISPNGVHPDLEVVISPLTPVLPGGEAVYEIVYRNKGNQTLSGNVHFYFDDSRLDLVSSIPDTNGESQGQLSYNFTNLMPFETRQIVIMLDVNSTTDDPGVNFGDTLSFKAIINNSNQVDETPEDNSYTLNQTVEESYISNEIVCLEGDVIGLEDVGKELHYLIRFENTGSFQAENIVVDMEIDMDKFNLSSVQLLDASHPAKARIINGRLEVFFEQAKVESGGHGNILLVVKTKEDLKEGDFVKNRANIYFDYNHPIKTTETVTFIEDLMTTANPDLTDSVSILPNPVKDKFVITSENKIKSVELFDMNGRLLRTELTNGNQTIQNIQHLNNGVYVVRVLTDKGIVVQKILKK